jgi:hypothetical protein
MRVGDMVRVILSDGGEANGRVERYDGEWLTITNDTNSATFRFEEEK